MAWYYMLAAEFGPDRAGAEALAAYFDGTRWWLPSETSFETTISAGCDRGQSGAWWMVAVPSGVGTSGGGDAETARRMTEIGSFLLDRLRSATPGYRFAGVGVEVFDFRDVEDLPPVLDSPALNGFVLSESLWASFGGPALFVPFSPGYRWRPYEGETARY